MSLISNLQPDPVQGAGAKQLMNQLQSLRAHCETSLEELADSIEVDEDERQDLFLAGIHVDDCIEAMSKGNWRDAVDALGYALSALDWSGRLDWSIA